MGNRHSGVKSNTRADELVKLAVQPSMTGSASIVGICNSLVNNEFTIRIVDQQIKEWQRTDGLRQDNVNPENANKWREQNLKLNRKRGRCLVLSSTHCTSPRFRQSQTAASSIFRMKPFYSGHP